LVIATSRRNKGTKTKTKKETRTEIQQRQNQRAHRNTKNAKSQKQKNIKHKKEASLVLSWGAALYCSGAVLALYVFETCKKPEPH